MWGRPGLVLGLIMAMEFAMAWEQESPGVLLVANKGDQSIGIIDPAQARMIAAVKASGFTAHEVIASPDGRFAYAPIYGNSGVGMPGTDGRTIDVIDIAGRRLVHTIDLGRPVRPHCPLFGPDGLLYVSAELANAVDVIDPGNGKIVTSLPTGQAESHMLALTRDGKRAYTSNVRPGTVTAVDLVKRQVAEIIKVADRGQRISLSIDDRFAFTSDQQQPRLAVIDTRTNSVSAWIPLPGIGYGSAPTRDGGRLLVAVLKVNKVAVVDLRQMKLERVIDVPPEPQEILVRPDGAIAYVSCDRSAKVAAVDLKTLEVAGLIDAGRGADGLAWAGR